MRYPWAKLPSKALLDLVARPSPEAAVRLLDSGGLDEEMLRHAAPEQPAKPERFSDLVALDSRTARFDGTRRK